MRLRTYAHEAEMLPPWYYGLAYREPWLRLDVFYPLPLNYLVRLARWLAWRWDWLRTRGPEWDAQLGATRERLRLAEQRGYERGHYAGKQEGYELGKQKGAHLMLGQLETMLDARLDAQRKRASA